jgi:DNA-binding response OmpR family regulator
VARLIIVDDDEDLLEMVSFVLRSQGMEIKSLSTGALLFKSMAIEKPDMLVMDVYLGDMDGRTICKQLKNTKEYSTVPVLLYSAGNISKTSIVDSLADDFLQKPFDVLTLVKRIEENIKKSRP